MDAVTNQHNNGPFKLAELHALLETSYVVILFLVQVWMLSQLKAFGGRLMNMKKAREEDSGPKGMLHIVVSALVHHYMLRAVTYPQSRFEFGADHFFKFVH